MAESSGFFNSINHDRVYQAEDFAAYYGDLFTNGVIYNEPTALQVVPGGAMSVTVRAGSAFINGYRYYNRSDHELTLIPSDAGYTRIDRIVVRWDLTERACYLDVLQGSLTANPAAPELTRNTQIWELGIADVMVPRASGLVEAVNIIDTRLNPSLCGASRTKTFMTYGEADTETLINDFSSVVRRVTALENQLIFTIRAVVPLEEHTTSASGESRPSFYDIGSPYRIADPRFRQGQTVQLAMADTVEKYSNPYLQASACFSVAQVSQGECRIAGRANRYLHYLRNEPYPGEGQNSGVKGWPFYLTFVVWN